MPKFEIEIGEDGKLDENKLPEELKPAFKAEFDRAFGKGAEKAAKEAKTQLETEIARVTKELKNNAGDPVLAERAKSLELELSQLKEAEATRNNQHVEAQRIRDERHAAELKDRDDKLAARDKDIERRTGRIRELVTSDIRIAAVKHGARQESLPELDQLLRSRIGLNPDDLQAFVADEKDPSKPAMVDGKPVTIDGLVQQYLTDHPHHKAPAGGRGGGAPGGKSMAGDNGGKTDEWSGLVQDVTQNPTHANVSKAVGKILEQAAGGGA